MGHFSRINRYEKEEEEEQEGKGMLLNASLDHKVRSVMVLTTSQVVLTSLQPSAVKNRAETKYKEK